MIIDTDKYIQVYSNCFDKVILKETIKELQSLKQLRKAPLKILVIHIGNLIAGIIPQKKHLRLVKMEKN